MNRQIKVDDLGYLSNCSPGQKFSDVQLKVDVSMKDLKLPGLTWDIADRLVDGSEYITTPAGTFECVVISSGQKKMQLRYEMTSKEWLSNVNGVFCSESYKEDKRISYTVVTRFSKECKFLILILYLNIL